MSRRKMIILICVAALAASTALAAKLNLMSVQIREGSVRNSPSFLGKVVAVVFHAEQVEILKRGEYYTKVRVQKTGVEGWINNTVLTKQKIVLKAGRKDAKLGASSKDLALAGRGFSKQVENAYRAENKELDYTWIDKIEEMKVSPEEMRAFLEEGALRPTQVAKGVGK